MAPAVGAGAPVVGCVLGRCPVTLWGLSSQERLRRQLELMGLKRLAGEDELSAAAGAVVLLRAEYLYDDRVLKGLVENRGVVLEVEENGRRIPVAAHVEAGVASRVAGALKEGRPVHETGLRSETPATISPSYRADLRKSEAPIVVRIDSERRQDLELHLFEGSYKGVTDLVTKWAWPAPARRVTAWCAERGIRPNTVTLVSLVLVFLVLGLFLESHFALGLCLAWVMTFLDTVDGKLARVTVRSSKLGDILDHGIDLIHPPFWYIAWGLGLPATQPQIAGVWVDTLLLVIVAGYVVGRLVEGVFSALLGSFGIFCWRPLDSYGRLVIARRNPNLLLLTASVLVGRPDFGILAVAVWTTVSALFLLARLAFAFYERFRSGPLASWLSQAANEEGGPPSLARPFVRRARVG